ncbi:MAG: U32 family peptidase [Paludibacteraceae bacterium]|nr:U32 family peptidase [Paludibacteraceae bacterium]
MSNRKLTLLAPARNLEVGIAAIQAGADAVYIGAPEFGARQAASNSLEDIAQLVKYAHRFGVQVLVTLNTLLHDNEYPRACALAHELYNIGVDALIIQDLHLLDYDLPPIRLHASTQCDNRTPEQVLRLQQLGFRRAVLARELSIEQIKEINNAIQSHTSLHHPTPPHTTLHRDKVAPIELEAFVHGALCVSYSGRCYLSEVLMNRSANRGCCAQPCRQRYDLLDKDGNEIIDDNGQPIHQRYLLSLQDMDRSLYLAEMIEAGITTFKIEGRLKDRDYVTNIVAYYRQLLDQLIDSNPTLQHASTRSVYQYDFTPSPAKTFHRGQTDYFLHGRTPNMANWQTPKSTGEKIGKIIAIKQNAMRVQLLPHITLHNGDGICYEDKGFAINRIEGDWIYPSTTLHHTTPYYTTLHDIKVGATLYRNMDNEFQRSLKTERRIPVDIRFETIAGGYRLTIGNDSAVFEAEHHIASNPTRALQTIQQQLSKLGDTDFIANSITIMANGETCTTEFPYFIPISQINQWRREIINGK